MTDSAACPRGLDCLPGSCRVVDLYRLSKMTMDRAIEWGPHVTNEEWRQYYQWKGQWHEQVVKHCPAHRSECGAAQSIVHSIGQHAAAMPQPE